MTITLTPETEARLRARAEQEGEDINTVADALINAALEWEARELAESIAGVRRGDSAAAEGKERSLTEFVAEQRAKHGFSAAWPHDAPDVDG